MTTYRDKLRYCAWKKCSSEHGAYVDNCGMCAPFWASFPICPICFVRLRLVAHGSNRNKLGTCLAHGKFRCDATSSGPGPGPGSFFLVQTVQHFEYTRLTHDEIRRLELPLSALRDYDAVLAVNWLGDRSIIGLKHPPGARIDGYRRAIEARDLHVLIAKNRAPRGALDALAAKLEFDS